MLRKGNYGFDKKYKIMCTREKQSGKIKEDILKKRNVFKKGIVSLDWIAQGLERLSDYFDWIESNCLDKSARIKDLIYPDLFGRESSLLIMSASVDLTSLKLMVRVLSRLYFCLAALLVRCS